jgi:hypothetical protein
MIKITIETDEEVVGVKDKHSWTIEDVVSLFEDLLRKSNFKLPSNQQIEITQVIPIEPYKEQIEAEGM